MTKSAAVTIPFVGNITVYVDDLPNSATEKDALEAAWDKIPDTTDNEWHHMVNELEYKEKLVTGNVIHFYCNEFEVEFENQTEDDDGDPGELKENQDFAQDDCELWIK